jgi:acetyltransferase-like isoleucine patch superfamily enzyme
MISLHQAMMDRVYTWELRLQGVQLGKGATAQGRANIQCLAGEIILGDGVILRSRDFGYHTQITAPTKLLTDLPDARIEIGDRCRLNGTTIHAKSTVTLGTDCYTAAGTVIVDSSGHALDAAQRAAGKRDRPAPITIGHRVWTGQSVLIFKGVTIGDDVIIGAGSVVTADLPAGTICGGQPAQVLQELP